MPLFYEINIGLFKSKVWKCLSLSIKQILGVYAHINVCVPVQVERNEGKES